MHFLDKKMKNYLIEKGEIFPDSDSARVLCEILDEDTMGRIDDQTDFKLTAYEPMRAWILQRDTKLKSRKAKRHRGSAKGPDDMVYGVESKAELPTAATAPEADPWLTSGDPWSQPPGLSPETPPPPEATWPGADAAWSGAAAAWPPPGGELDAFGKGKGKSKGKG